MSGLRRPEAVPRREESGIVCDMCCCSFFPEREGAVGYAVVCVLGFGKRCTEVVKCCPGWSVHIAFQMSRLLREQLT